MSPFPVIVLVGPTAVGKTEISLQLAKRIDAEIVSADSRQIYKYMSIGTAKPSVEERKSIPHHFIDFLEPGQEFSAGEYGLLARETILNILAKDKNVIVAGGSGLYIRALLKGMITFDKKNTMVRNNLKNQMETTGLPGLYRQLQSCDPVLASRLSPNDSQRILRGLEVYLISGKRLSDIQKEEEPEAPFKYVQIGLTMNRETLYKRINQRVEYMFENGLIDEVKILFKKKHTNANALNAVGYKEIIGSLDGETDLDTAKEIIKKNTRNFAKRQMTWFNKDKTINWIDLTASNSTDEIIDRILKICR